jgi:RNA polymerase sigma-70 factor (sigma-E family)
MDTEALELLFTAHHAATLRLAYLLTHDHMQAEDVVAEVFMKVARLGRAPDSPAAYLRRAVVNEVNSLWRRKARERAYLQRQREDTTILADFTPRADDQEVLWRALDTLPPRQRTAVVLRYFEDLPERETARVMGVTVGTVKSTTARGLVHLREAIGEPVLAA